MEIDDTLWAQKLAKEDEIRETRYDKRNDKNEERECCDNSEIKFIIGHGHIDPNNNFILPPNYKVILITAYGKQICLRISQIDKIKDLYRRGHTLFENNDTEPSQLTQEGSSMLFQFSNVNNFNPRLFIGGTKEMGGKHIASYIPNVHLYFGGSNCDNWGGNSDPDNIKYNCYIDCVNTEKPSYDPEDSICEKYYFSNDYDPETDYNDDRNKRNMRGIDLKTLLLNEGPGTYILVTCLEASRHITKEDLDYYNKMTQTAKRDAGQPSSRTRFYTDEQYKLFGLKNSGGKKHRKHKTRKQKTRKHKTRKQKTRKHKTRKQKTRKQKTRKQKNNKK